MKKILLAACIAAAYGYTGFASAQTAPAAPAAPSLGAVLAATPGLSVSGYIASTYTHFDSIPSGLRAYDNGQNGFKLNQASLTVSYLPSSGAGGLVSLLAGTDAKILRNGELQPQVYPKTSLSTNSQFDLYNAYVQYVAGPVTAMAGKFSSMAGAESTNPVGDSEISRGLLFWDLEPGSLTGLRATVALGSNYTVFGGVNNGWGPTSPVPGAGQTYEIGVTGNPSKMFSFSGAYYTGKGAYLNPTQSNTDGTYGVLAPYGKLDVLDLVGTFNATDALSFVANADLLSKDLPTGTAKANGLALYANYTITEQWMLGLRGEYVDDKDGLLTGSTGNKLKEVTLAANYMPVKNLKLSAEVRQDKSDAAIYSDTNGTTKTSQTSFELQAVYSF